MAKWLVAAALISVLTAGCVALAYEDGSAVAGADGPPGSATVVPTATAVTALISYGPAPEIASDMWLNTDVPLALADLRGKVVLLEMWTYG
jgi:hypothetical protein